MSCLHKVDNWEIRTTNESAKPLYGLHSYIAHYCPVLKTCRYWWALPLAGRCVGCNYPPPEDVLGLWKLHNFDYIQNGEG